MNASTEPVIAVMPPTSAAARRVLRAYFAELASRYYEKQLPFGTGKGRPPVI